MGVSFRSPHRQASIHRTARLELAETAVLCQTSALPSHTRKRLPKRSTSLLSEPEALPAGGLSRHSEKTKGALDKLSRTLEEI